jgi:hypothetical protein
MPREKGAIIEAFRSEGRPEVNHDKKWLKQQSRATKKRKNSSAFFPFYGRGDGRVR